MFRAAISMRWTITLAIIVGLLLSFAIPSLLNELGLLYDGIRPVVSMHGELIERQADQVTLKMTGTKNRDCRYMGMQTFAEDSDGSLHDVYRQRYGTAEGMNTKPKGTFDLGRWRIWPIDDDTAAILVFVTHECGGRLVQTKIADVKLKE